MNTKISHLPKRTTKPRENGLNMVMDKGLSLRQAEDFIEINSERTDLLKLGFGTSLITPNIKEKVKLYRDAGIDVYCGGTLFEAFYIRNSVDDYLRFIDDLGIECLEVSDGSMVINEDDKCEMIRTLSANYKVLSEVGSKEAGILISPSKWTSMMSQELEAGSWKVIAEARESGNVGIYRPNGSAHTALIRKILTKVSLEDILWEAPKKPQQVWFIQQFGANVNLGNIGPWDVIPLETLRLGLRGDTFFDHLPEKLATGLRQEVDPESE
ncbi:MAG: phosphosulfolactate synthase [Bacteroidetes bacterium]|nr:MAG: phosphosulfolactate synthase [Bacteroidota bacterium]